MTQRPLLELKLAEYTFSYFSECRSGFVTLFPDNRNDSETELYISLIPRGGNTA